MATSDATGLLEFLAARLGEDERDALDAKMDHSGEWSWAHGYGEMCGDPTCPYGSLVNEKGYRGTDDVVLMEVHGYDIREPWQGAAHIARHDPARVLREVEAKRRIIGQILAYEAAADGEFGCCHSPEAIAAGECPMLPPNQIVGLRVLALPDADHPDYRSEWSV